MRWQRFAPIVASFDLAPEEGSSFPPYTAGQYIALARDNCHLTQKVVRENGEVEIIPQVDEEGKPKLGRVTHSYSIASAPYETQQNSLLHFYIVLEHDAHGRPGRLTSSFFKMEEEQDPTVFYHERIAGDFTLEKRVGDAAHLLMVGTGTGIAPFVSMLKQLHFEAENGKKPPFGITLIHTNRTTQELNYREVFEAIAQKELFDFVYLPSVSRPTEEDRKNRKLGLARANNLLRSILGEKLREEELLEEARAKNENVAQAEAHLQKTVTPRLPGSFQPELLRKRLLTDKTVVMTCGNPQFMEDIQRLAERFAFRFEKEEW